MHLYDHPDPRKPGRLIRGYDCKHALRTACLCAAVARRLGHPDERLQQFQIACLLHDVGRAGLDAALFGKIWSWARRNGIPTRPREWRALHPATPYGLETEAFCARHAKDLAKLGVPLDERTFEQVEMRLGYARRLSQQLRVIKSRLAMLGVKWAPWMQRVMLYYYYPEKLKKSAGWVRELAEILVACEQFEAYNNRRRGRDYYTRNREMIGEAFGYLEKLRADGMVRETVVNAVRDLAAEGAFDKILAEARSAPLSERDLRYLRGLKTRPMRPGSPYRSVA